MNQPNILIVLPLYNHSATVGAVLCEIFGIGLLVNVPVLVVDDGSTDNGAEKVVALQAEYPNLNLLRHPENLGKGAAILSAAAWAKENGHTHIITIDSDGQHCPKDLPAFCSAILNAPQKIFIGARNFNVKNVPASSRFGRSFSNFWMRVQTGQSVSDMQSGLRAYPVQLFSALFLFEKRYSFEVEVLVKAAWAGFIIECLPIEVFYPPAAERISHFKTIADNVRIAFLNTRLTIRAMIPVPFRRYSYLSDGKISVLHPLNSLRLLLSDDNTPLVMAFSTFAAITICALPLIGLQSIILLLAIGYFKLNRLWVLAVSHLCWPPLFPAICIEAGYYLRHGEFLTDISWQTLGDEALQRFYEWFIGAVTFAPVAGFALAAIIYLFSYIIQKSIAPAQREGA